MGVFNKLVLDQNGLVVGKRQIDASQDGVYFSGNGHFGSNLLVSENITVGGNTAITGNITAVGDITAFFSDKRLKKNIEPINNAIDKLKQMNGVMFSLNDTAIKYGFLDSKTHVGLIAQEVERVLPEVVVRAPFDTGIGEDGTEYSKSGEEYKAVQYDKLVPLLIQAIKEQQVRIEYLEEKINKNC